MGQKGLFSAGVRCLDLPLPRHNVVPVEPIQENNPRLPIPPGRVDNFIKYNSGIQLFHRFPRMRIDQLVLPACFRGVHKVFCQSYGKIKIGNLRVICLTVNKLQNIRVVDTQDSHVGAAPRSALFDGFGSHIKHFHKTDRTAGHSSRGVNRASFRSEPGKGKSGSPSALMNQRSLLNRLENRFHAVVYRQHKTGGKLSQIPSGVHQGR